MDEYTSILISLIKGIDLITTRITPLFQDKITTNPDGNQ